MTAPKPPAGKSEWRAALLSARRAVSAEARAAEARALASATHALITSVAPGTACGYLPIGAEPGSPAMLDAMAAAGWRVLLPVVAGGGPLEWAEYAGVESLRAGPHGLLEPSGPRLGASVLGAASLLLIPALAVDLQGVRLGRGAGYYDRSLPLADPGAQLVAVVRDAELVDELPSEPHDVRMTAALTPGHGLRKLG